MIPFSTTLTELAPLSPFQNSLALPLAEAIKINGNINTDGLCNQITQYYAALNTASNTNSTASHIDLELDIGIDEVGRGPLYGSVVVSAVILPKPWSAEIEFNPLQDTPLSILTDSKKLTELKRERLFEPIKQHALAYMIVEIPAAVIDDINILQATLMGMRLAAEQTMIQVVQALQSHYLQSGLAQSDYASVSDQRIGFSILVDGNKVPELNSSLLQQYEIGEDLTHPVKSEAWVKGDGRHSAIAAASVLAKVSRDRQLVADAKSYPGYGLESHKGYPTKAHIEAIQKLGVLPQHRRSFKPIQQFFD